MGIVLILVSTENHLLTTMKLLLAFVLFATLAYAYAEAEPEATVKGPSADPSADPWFWPARRSYYYSRPYYGYGYYGHGRRYYSYRGKREAEAEPEAEPEAEIQEAGPS